MNRVELPIHTCPSCTSAETCAVHARPPSSVFTEAEYKADAGKVIAHAVATGTAVVARADGSTRVVISIPPAYGEVVCIDCRRPIEDCDEAPGDLCRRCVVTAEPDSDLTQAAIGMLRVAERTVLLPWKLIRAVWRTVTGH